jgi:hypothetical protein
MKTGLRFVQAAVVGIVLASGAIVAGTAAWSASTQKAAERFTAFAINMNRSGPSTTATVDISITSWTPDAQRDRLLATAKESSPKSLLDALQDSPVVGTIKTPDSVAYDLRYARQMPGPDGGRRIVLMTDRPMSFWELRSQSRSVDYPFMLIELRVDKDGNGEGKLSTATRIVANELGMLTLENYDLQPVQLQKVRKL